ncbi:MAG: hypothetical protein JW900_07945 [Anaerolineae bacterium]|nr:hypothetical protein [Anaerolineae bacterium]
MSKEWKWVLVVSAVALLLTSIPYLLGLVLQTETRVFGGFVIAVEDIYSYLAKMRRGAEGDWLFHVSYTPEPHSGTLFYLFYLLLGKAAACLPGMDLTSRIVCTYHAARWLFGTGLLLTVYRFLAAFTADRRERQMAFLFVAFGGGFGWLLMLLGQSGWLGSLPLDFILPEGFTFLVLYTLPHIALARTLFLWGILFLLRAWGLLSFSPTSRAARFSILAGLAWFLMGLILPFYLAVAWAVTGAMGLALALRQRRLPWREARLALLPLLIPAPVVLYSVWVFASDAVYASWAAQNLIRSPHPLHYLAAFGLLLALGALAARRTWREEGPGWTMLAWIAVVPLLAYLPVNVQRRLVEGVQIPLSLLAARGVVGLARPGTRLQAITLPLLVVLSLTNGVLVGGSCLAVTLQSPPIFRDIREVAALDWLNDRVQADDVVLAAYETGNYLPVRVGARVFVGHGPESVNCAEKKRLVARFFDPATSDVWRRELLAEYQIDWVFWDPPTQALGDFDPRGAPYLELVYQDGEYAILQVAEETE